MSEISWDISEVKQISPNFFKITTYALPCVYKYDNNYGVLHYYDYFPYHLSKK